MFVLIGHSRDRRTQPEHPHISIRIARRNGAPSRNFDWRGVMEGLGDLPIIRHDDFVLVSTETRECPCCCRVDCRSHCLQTRARVRGRALYHAHHRAQLSPAKPTAGSCYPIRETHQARTRRSTGLCESRTHLSATGPLRRRRKAIAACPEAGPGKHRGGSGHCETLLANRTSCRRARGAGAAASR